jgi:hypothetical protein
MPMHTSPSRPLRCCAAYIPPTSPSNLPGARALCMCRCSVVAEGLRKNCVSFSFSALPASPFSSLSSSSPSSSLLLPPFDPLGPPPPAWGVSQLGASPAGVKRPGAPCFESRASGSGIRCSSQQEHTQEGDRGGQRGDAAQSALIGQVCPMSFSGFVRQKGEICHFRQEHFAALVARLWQLHPKLGFKKRQFKKPLVGRS